MAKIYDFNDAPRQVIEPERPVIPQDFIAAFRKAMIDEGFTPPGDISPGGDIQRFGKKKECWYVLYADGVPAGAFGSWKTDQTIRWCAKDEVVMTEEEARQYRVRIDRIREAREAESRRRHNESASEAAKVWEKSPPVQSHPYLDAKKVPSYGLRFWEGCLLIPALDTAGKIHTYQTIAPNGNKLFLTGGEKRGHFFTIPGTGKVAIAEGYATAASIHLATGWTCIVAFDCGNILPVAQAVRLNNPTADLVIAADNDQWTEYNPGLTKAREAAEVVRATVIVPEFCETSLARKATDWNDLHCLEGIDEVKRQTAHIRKMEVMIRDWGIDKYQGSAPQRQWLIKDTFPLACSIVFAAMGGSGKGFLSLDLALKVAGHHGTNLCPLEAFGNPVATHGSVVIFSAEDDQDEIHRRLEAIGREAIHPVFILPLPDIRGPMPLVVPGRNGPELTTWWHDFEEQLLEIRPVLIVIDPMAAFVMADINADPAVGQFVQMLLASLAKRTGATIIIAHHMSKTRDNISTPEQARALVRGTSAIVDGARGVYVMWQTSEEETQRYCKLVDREFERDRVYKGCLAKANFSSDKSIKVFVRNSYGLLEALDERATSSKSVEWDIWKSAMISAISEAAKAGQPFSKSGSNGVYERKHDLPIELRGIGRSNLWGLVEYLLEKKEIVLCPGSPKSRRLGFLDIPSGPFGEMLKCLVPSEPF